MIYGTTLHIGQHDISTIYGKFTAHTFQNLISSKHYIIALCFGDISQSILYTRIHSSCVTSETMCGMDCDCVEQLNGALETIAHKGAGILFYLIQEGRGAGYIAKSRDRMMVQHSLDSLSTFDAYKQMGLKSDHRDYTNVAEICHLLNINPQFILLSNNPDKLAGMQKIGLNVTNMEKLEFEPSAFNAAYLRSKQKYGHKLDLTTSHFQFPLDKKPIEPFAPYILAGSRRFIHCSSYYLPIKPVVGEQPHWFKVNVYYDIATSNDYVILEYRECNAIPIVRIHSESIFNRFPLVDDNYKNIYKKSVQLIVENGHGYIGLFYQDGRGYGVGAYVLDQIGNKKTNGIVHDIRDYYGISQLLAHHIPDKHIKLVTTSTKNENILLQLSRNKLVVNEVICLAEDPKGHQLLEERLQKSVELFTNIIITKNRIVHLEKVVVTGIGSSSSHAYFLQQIGANAGLFWQYMPIHSIGNYQAEGKTLILFSQGLSPNAQILFDYKWRNIVLFTAVNSGNQEKLNLFNKCDQIINFPMENEYGTLIRFVGPLIGYNAAVHWAKSECLIGTLPPVVNWKYNEKELEEIARFIVEHRPQIKIVFNSRQLTKDVLQNICLKFLEGIFYNSQPELCDILEFSHGYYQNLLHNPSKNLLVLLDDGAPEMQQIRMLCAGKCTVWDIVSKQGIMNVCHWENVFNHLILQLVQQLDIDQRNWQGDDKKNPLYLKSHQE